MGPRRTLTSTAMKFSLLYQRYPKTIVTCATDKTKPLQPSKLKFLVGHHLATNYFGLARFFLQIKSPAPTVPCLNSTVNYCKQHRALYVNNL